MTLQRSALFIALFLSGACQPVFSLHEPPSTFSQYPEEDERLRLISPEGVKVLIRRRRNYPLGEGDFWREAISGHLQRNGYLERSRSQIVATAQRPEGHAVSFTRPYRGEDWGYLITVFVDGDELILVEMSGLLMRFDAALPELLRSLAGFSWER